MAFDAGSVVAKVILDSAQFTSGMGSVTGSMFKGQLAFAAFQKVLDVVVGTVGDCVKAFNEQQKAEAQLNAVLKSTGQIAGVTASQALDLASALQKTTTYADETILGAENLLLTFTKIGKDIFPQATKVVLDMSTALGQDLKSSAIQVGKALQDPILGVTALRRVGVNFSDAQRDVIKNLVETGRAAEAQAMILKELQTEFGGSAEAAGKTFAGSLAILNNQLGESQETLGMYMTAAAKPFVDQLRVITDGMNEWLQSAEGMATMTNVFSTLAGVGAVVWLWFEKIFGIFKEAADNILKPLVEAISNLTGEGQEANVVFAIMSKIFDVVGFVVGTLSKGIGAAITVIGGFIKVIGDSIGVLVALENMRKGIGTWDQVVTAADNVGASFTDMTTKSQAAIDEFNEYGKRKLGELLFGGAEMAKELGDAYVKASDTVKNSITDMATVSAQSTADLGKSIQDNLDGPAEKVRQTWFDVFGDLQKNLADTTAKFGIGSQQWQFAFSDFVNHVKDGMQGVFDVVGTVWDQISGIITQAIANQQTILDKQYEQDKAQIEASVTDEAEKTKQLAALDAQYEADKKKLQHDAFEAEKAGNILSTIMNTATAVTNALASVPWPFNLIVAGIMGTLGAIQTGLVAAQVNPYAEGGVAHGWSLVGENGPELMNVGSPSRIMSNEDSRSMLGGGAGQTNYFTGPIYRETDLDNMLLLAGARYQSARRGA